MSLGENIRRLRSLAGLTTQKAFLELLGVPRSQVSDWENDRHAVLEIATLIRLAKLFRCSLDDLLEGVDPDYDRAARAAQAEIAWPGARPGPTSRSLQRGMCS